MSDNEIIHSGNFSFGDYQSQFDENISAGEIRVSRVAIMQPGSPEITNTVSGYKPGMLVDTVTREILTREMKSPWLQGKVDVSELANRHCLLIVPAFKLPSEFIKWKDRKTEGTGWHFKTLDRNDPRVREGLWPGSGGTWGKKEGQVGSPPVTENCNYMCMVVEKETKEDGEEKLSVVDSGIIFTFSKTSFNAGRSLTTYIRKGFQRRIPAFGVSYWIYTTKELSKNGEVYYAMNCAPGSVVKDRDILDMAFDWHRKFSEPSSGQALQAMYLNSAEIGDEGSDEVNSVNNSHTSATEVDEDDVSGQSPF